MLEYRSILNNRKFVFALIAMLLATCVIYMLSQWIYFKNIADMPFIAMRIFATCYLIMAMGRIYNNVTNRGMSVYFDIYQSEHLDFKENDVFESFSNTMENIFGNKNTLLAGICFGLMFMGALFYLETWKENVAIRFTFLVFSGVVNFVTGMAIFSLIGFFRLIAKLINKIKIDIWDLNSNAVTYIRRLRNVVTRTISIYISITLSSVVFSEIGISKMYFAYTVFAIILLCMAFLFPEISIRNRTESEKQNILLRFNRKIKTEYEELLQDKKQSIINEQEKLKYINDLFETRDKVLNLSNMKAAGTNILSVISVILITAFPVLLQIFLEKFIK